MSRISHYTGCWRSNGQPHQVSSASAPLYRKFGFTLAEVLITLGIIGVVAAMTLPGVITDYRARANLVRLKKSVSTIENGFKLAMAKDGVSNLLDTKLFQNTSSNGCFYYPCSEQFKEEFEHIFKVVRVIKSANTANKLYGIYNLNGQIHHYYGRHLIVLEDGLILEDWQLHNVPKSDRGDIENRCKSIKKQGGKLCYYVGSLTVDVDGISRRNTYGVDLFRFFIGDDGMLYPAYGKDVAMMYSYNPITWNNTFYYKNNTDYKCNTKADRGIGCAARIMEDGWEMNYLK